MLPNELRSQQKLLSRLRQTPFPRYVGLLSRVIDGLPQRDCFIGLRAAFVARDFSKLLLEADSLSKQKYLDATEHFVANQISLLIRKYPWDSRLVKTDPRAKALAKFRLTEVRCKRLNRKHELLEQDRSRDRFSKEVGRARFWIRSVIGSRPNYSSIAESCDFGPGASVGVHGNATSYAAKAAADSWTVTPGAIHHGYLGIRKNHHLWELLLPRRGNFVCYDEEAAFAAYLRRTRVITNNKISFVPKTAITDRTIAVEPLLNGFFQKGIDAVLRQRLRRFNIDLSDQGRNAEFARLGSLSDDEDSFVTIDLESASDSISTSVVRRLVPADWFSLLERTRSKYYEIDGEVNPYHKFCSMGNGFCFPLETLVFASACVAVGCGSPGKDFLVYGDDIIVRKKYASLVIEFLKHLGFKTNNSKTFLEGPFRESCGSDWYGGKDVRPFTLDFELDSLQNIFKFLNLTRRSEKTSLFFFDIREYILDMIPKQYRFYRPFKGQSDTGIDSTGDEHLYASSCHFKNGRWRWKELSFSPRRDFVTLEKTRDQPWLISVALRGSRPISTGRYLGIPEVTLRRQTQTKVAWESYSATSNWLPTPKRG